ncbi:hypothetical protein C8R46DRAFT_1085212 [Mycena filopes]|nr:hypothetical protein C8R46DRAFT_1085212 [Mycena filopes]
MTSNLRDHKINSALYQYGVPIAVFAFAAACITIYFRMTVATQRRRRQAAADTEGKESLNAAMKPVLFDTYVADGWWDPRLEDGTTLSVNVKEWEEIMPLSVASFRGGSATHTTKEEQQHPDAIPGATATDSKFDASRVRVSVVIRMPGARTASIPPAVGGGDDESDATPLPYLEFGVVEVDVSRGEDGVPPLPAVES